MDPLRFDLQRVADILWTLTDRCNLSCSYCTVVPHHGPPPEEQPLDKIERVLGQLATLPNLQSVVVSGGEALLSSHLDRVLGGLAQVAPVTYLITNGTVYGTRMRDTLRRHRPRVMVTIDSMDEESNARTRGRGVLRRSLRTLEWLLANDFFTIVIVVLTAHNVESLGESLEQLHRRGVRNVLIQQLHCSDPSLRDFFRGSSPTHAQLAGVHRLLAALRQRHPDLTVDDNEVCFFENRPQRLRALCDPDKDYHPQRLFRCGAAFDFFALKANGDVIPCNALLQCVGGNVHQAELAEILAHSDEFTRLRRLREHRVDIIQGCGTCSLNPICDGGCRADAFNLTGEIGSPHPLCPVHAAPPGGLAAAPPPCSTS